MVKENTELQQDLDEAQAQLIRCKRTLSGILLAAGETRGESSVKTTLRTFFDDIVQEWRSTRDGVSLEYQSEFCGDLPIAADSTVQQMVHNVLDNALESSPQWVGLTVMPEGDTLQIQVSDRGRGFPPSMLERLGTPYQSSKGRTGRGLGLFLSINVAHSLGGRLLARNDPNGGAVVTIYLPLSALTIPLDEPVRQ